jgi:hypothetical protein
MQRNLAEQIAHARGAPIRVGDVDVYGLYRIPVSRGQAIRVRRVTAVSWPTQGLRLKLDAGLISIGGQNLGDIVLWADSAPEEVELTCNTTGERGILKLWNAWRDERGATQAWIGNAGIVVEPHGDLVTLRCSDGVGDVHFGDLVVVIAQIED